MSLLKHIMWLCLLLVISYAFMRLKQEVEELQPQLNKWQKYFFFWVKSHQLKSHDIAINVLSVKNIFSCKQKLTLKASEAWYEIIHSLYPETGLWHFSIFIFHWRGRQRTLLRISSFFLSFLSFGLEKLPTLHAKPHSIDSVNGNDKAHKIQLPKSMREENIDGDKLWLKVKEGNDGDEMKAKLKANENLWQKSRFQLFRIHVRINLKSKATVEPSLKKKNLPSSSSQRSNR